MPEAPRTDGEQDARAHQRSRRGFADLGLLLEDEQKSALATFIQDLFRGLVGILFYLIPSVTHDVVIHGREHVTWNSPTIILSNHKRDLDSLVLAGVVYFARGLAHPNRRMIFALREDAFWPEFLAAYLQAFPRLRPMVRQLRCAGPIRLLKAYPMGMLRARSDYHRIEGQLTVFARLLDRGRDLYWTPEGGLTLDGHLERFRAGLWRIIERSRTPLELLPVGVIYDFMTTGRTRCFISIGAPLAVDRARSRHEIEQAARRAILRQMTVNAGHLLAAALRDLPEGATLPRTAFEARLLAEGRRLHALGYTLDGRLTVPFLRSRRFRQLFGYARKQHILASKDGSWRVAEGLANHQVRYALNELYDIEQASGGVG